MDTTDRQTSSARSSFITVLAWIFIVLTGFATLISLAQNIMINTMFPIDQMHDAMHAAKKTQNIPPAVEFMSNHFRLFFGVFFLLSVSTFASSIALLKRKNWARVFFIFLMSLGIVWNIGGLFIQQFIFNSMPSPPPTASPEFQEQFKSMATTMLIFSSIVAIGFSILFAWIIKKLVSPAIKGEFGADLNNQRGQHRN